MGGIGIGWKTLWQECLLRERVEVGLEEGSRAGGARGVRTSDVTASDALRSEWRPPASIWCCAATRLPRGECMTALPTAPSRCLRPTTYGLSAFLSSASCHGAGCFWVEQQGRSFPSRVGVSPPAVAACVRPSARSRAGSIFSYVSVASRLHSTPVASQRHAAFVLAVS